MKTLLDTGRRIERLLMLAGPLAFFCFLFLLASYGTSNRDENKLIAQLNLVVDRLNSNLRDLESAHARYRTAGAKSRDVLADAYQREVRFSALFSATNSSLERLAGSFSEISESISPRLSGLGTRSPTEIISSLADEANKLRQEKNLVLGVEFPEKAKISILGTELGLQSKTYVTLLQISLAPMLILWLGSLYATRLREALLIREAKYISLLFPHVLNIYPMGKFVEPRRRSWTNYYGRYLIHAVYSLFRIGALSLFIAPTVIAYVVGSYFQLDIDRDVLPMWLGAIVGLLASMLVLVELLPVHFLKAFSHEITNT